MSRKIRRRMFAMATAVAAFSGIGTVVAPSPAQAATPDPGTAVSAALSAAPFHICLANAGNLCLASNGAGNQVTIQSSDYAVFHTTASRVVNGTGQFQFENAAGSCLRAGDNNVVKFQGGGCDSTFENDWWGFGASDNLVSAGRGQEMYTRGDQAGRDVWWGPFQSGQWFQWSTPPA
jgi:hypothetical protein